jgi:hypothetical protein
MLAVILAHLWRLIYTQHMALQAATIDTLGYWMDKASG